MGCGGSTARPVDAVGTAVVPAAGQHKQKSPASSPAAAASSQQQQPASPHSQQRTGSALSSTSGKGSKRQKQGNGGADSGAPVPATTATAAPPPEKQHEKKEKARLKRLSSDQPPVTAAGALATEAAAAAPSAAPCDNDPSHEATLWCAQCEEALCGPCDARAHPQGAAHKHQHQRRPLGGGGGSSKSRGEEEKEGAQKGGPPQPKPKFVVREHALPARGPSNDAAGSSAAAAAATPTSPVVPGARRFKVGKFGSNLSNGSSSMLQPDMDAPVGTRLKHAPRGAALTALGDWELSHMNHYELELLWHKYDKDRNHVLDRAEMRRLAEEVIARVLKLVRDDMARSNPEMSPEELDEQLLEERAFVLPGKNQKETEREMIKRLQDALDVNHDGKVTKQEYLAQWNEFAAEVFQLKQEGAIACSIM